MSNITQGIILAAGRGSRLNEMTASKPKCLTEIAGKTLIQWQFDAMRASGIDHIAVLRGYLKETLTPDTLKEEFSTIDNDRWNETNMVATLACAMELLLSQTCIISYSDIVYHQDHVAKLMSAKGDIVITFDTHWQSLWQLRFDNPLDDAETFIEDSGVLKEIGSCATTIEQIQGQYMGLIKITPTGWGQISDYLNSLSVSQRDRLDMTGMLSNLLSRGVTINTVPVSGKWAEVDTQCDLFAYEDQLSNNSWVHNWR